MKRQILNLMKPFILPFNNNVLTRYYKGTLPQKDILAERILILAPHVDDETIGLGGTALKLAAQGKDIHCIYITDGAGSVSTIKKNDLVSRRKQEAAKVKDILGLTDIYFLDEPDGQVRSHVTLVEKINQFIEKIKPEVIFCPTFIDCHPDHVQTSITLAKALETVRYEGEVWCYEINCPIEPTMINSVIDITEYQNDKEQAIRAFESQAIDFDGFLYLSKIKKNLLEKNNNVQYVETFFTQPFEQFRKRALLIEKQGIPYASLFKQINKTETLIWGIYQGQRRKKEFYEQLKGL